MKMAWAKITIKNTLKRELKDLSPREKVIVLRAVRHDLIKALTEAKKDAADDDIFGEV